jgi:hypothetical protein
MGNEQIQNGHSSLDPVESSQNGHVPEPGPGGEVGRASEAGAAHVGAGDGKRQHGGGISRLRPLFSLRSRPIGSLSEPEQHTGTVRHLAVSGVLLALILSVIMSAPLTAGQVEIREGCRRHRTYTRRRTCASNQRS